MGLEALRFFQEPSLPLEIISSEQDGIYFVKPNGSTTFSLYVIEHGVLVPLDAVNAADFLARLNLKVDKVTTVNGHPLSSNVVVTKADVGLSNVDNTSDANKPVSTAQATALGLKVDKTTTVNGHALSANVTVTKADVSLGNVDNTSDATKNAATATLTNKTINGANNTLSNISADSVIDGTANKVYTAAEKTKLAGIATAATANDTDANLLNRANHTGTQPFTTISGTATAAQIPNLPATKITSGTFPIAQVNAALTGLATTDATEVVATDTILQAIGKLQAQINAL